MRYIKDKMHTTFAQLQDNDSKKMSQLKCLQCNFKGHENKHCKTSVEVLYRHMRCGLVHNYFESDGYVVINRPNKGRLGTIIDRSQRFGKYVLALNGPAFVEDFLASL